MPSANGQWEGALEIPANATGNLIVRATAGEQVGRTDYQRAAPNIVPPFITLVHPTAAGTPSAGAPSSSRGACSARRRAPSPSPCSTTAARRPPPSSRSTLAPGAATGASSSSPRSHRTRLRRRLFWRARRRGVACATACSQVVPPDDPDARGLFLGNFPDNDVPRGEPVTVYGSAYNAPNRQVQVSLEVGGAAVADGHSHRRRLRLLGDRPDAAGNRPGRQRRAIRRDGSLSRRPGDDERAVCGGHTVAGSRPSSPASSAAAPARLTASSGARGSTSVATPTPADTPAERPRTRRKTATRQSGKSAPSAPAAPGQCGGRAARAGRAAPRAGQPGRDR
jgi:hypothetical protein